MPKPVDPTNPEFKYRAFQTATEVAEYKLRDFDDAARRVNGR